MVEGLRRLKGPVVKGYLDEAQQVLMHLAVMLTRIARSGTPEKLYVIVAQKSIPENASPAATYLLYIVAQDELSTLVPWKAIPERSRGGISISFW